MSDTTDTNDDPPAMTGLYVHHNSDHGPEYRYEVRMAFEGEIYYESRDDAVKAMDGYADIIDGNRDESRAELRAKLKAAETRANKAEEDLKLARSYGEHAYGHDLACLEMASAHEKTGDLGLGGLGGLLEYTLTPPIPPPWDHVVTSDQEDPS